MTIPFLDIFKKWTDRFKPVSTSVGPGPARPVAPVAAKPGGERLSKTVMPNTTRSTSSDFFKEAGDSAPNVRAAGMRALPPTVALALQPNVERAISLTLSDLAERVPAGRLKPAESFDAGQTILLKASEIEKGMADGKPAVSLFSIYEQVPEIFLNVVRPDDATQVPVPHGKVLEQLRRMQVRDDQETESSVPQVDTPILKVTIEDTQRFGTPLPEIKTSIHPRVKVEPPTARAFSNAEPEVAVSEKGPSGRPAPAGISLNLTTPPKITPRPSVPNSAAPTRIPFKLSPKGAGEPAAEKVPASRGSSVPPPVPVSTSAARIPFKMTPPSDDLKPKLQIVPGVSASETRKAPATAAAPSDAKISLGLRPLVQNMPSFQLHRSAESVAAEARVELPLTLVESQLASGRIAIPIKLFRDALPADYKELIVLDAAESPVLLPLQEVLKNLSPNILKMRDDQVAEELSEGFETPFSIKAAEDAKRFSAPPVEEEPQAAVSIEAKAQPTKEAESKQPEVAKESSESPTPVKLPEISKGSEAPKEPVATQPQIAKAVEGKQPEPATEKRAEIPSSRPATQPETVVRPAPVATPKVEVKQDSRVEPTLETKTEKVTQPEAAKPAVAEVKPGSAPALKLTVPSETKPEPVSAPKLSVPVETKSEAPPAPKPFAVPIAPKAESAPGPKLSVPVETKSEGPPAPKPFAVPVATKSESVPAPKPAPPVERKIEASAAPAQAPAKIEPKPEVNTNAKAIVEQANALPGIAATVVMMEDGLNLAGTLPDDFRAGGLCAIAPSILQKINRHTADTKLGQVVSMTLSFSESQLSFFMARSVCLAALHSQPVLPGDTHYQLISKVTELSRIYAQPGEKHVDH